MVSNNTPVLLLTDDQKFRLRMLLHVDNVDLPVLADNFKLQFAPAFGACDTKFIGENYIDVTDTTLIAYNDNTSVSAVDGAPMSPNAGLDPTHLGHTNTPQSYEELNNASTLNTVPAGQDGIWDFSLKVNGAPTNVKYCFRVVKSNGAALNSYSYIPELTTRLELNTNYTWWQQDWSGGLSSLSHNHTDESANPGIWTKYASSSNDLIIGTDITISDSSGQIIENSSNPASPTYFSGDPGANTEVVGDSVKLLGSGL